MALLDLRGPVPNCGAHRVAWVILLAADPSGKMGELDQLLGANMAERLISGDVTPGSSMGVKLHRWSNGRIYPQHFYQETAKRWREAPHGFAVPKPMRKAA